MGESKELIKHWLQLPHDRGYQTAVTLLEYLWESSQDTIIISKGGKGMAPDQIWWFQSIPKILQLLLKYKSISGSLQWNTMDTPEMLHMLIAKLPGRLIDRWYRNAQAIRKRQLHEPDLEDLITIVEEGRVLMNDPLCSRETLHENTKHLERSTHVKARKLKNCYTKADEKVEDS